MKTLNLRAGHILAVAAMALSSGATASAQYTFVAVNVKGSASTTVSGINNNNLITGTYATTNGYTYGFTLDPNTHTWHYPISDPNGIGFSYLTTSNTAGTLAGYYYNWSIDELLGMSGQSGTFTDVSPAGCAAGIHLTGINDAATPTLVGYCDTNQEQTVAWIGYPHNLTYSCPLADTTVASAVNNWLLSVGYYGDVKIIHGYIATDFGTCTTIDYPGAYSTAITGTNDYGTMTGTYWPGSGKKSHGFLTDGNGNFTSIDHPKARSTSLGQINNNNWFVGNYIDLKGISHAFYAKPSGAAQ